MSAPGAAGDAAGASQGGQGAALGHSYAEIDLDALQEQPRESTTDDGDLDAPATEDEEDDAWAGGEEPDAFEVTSVPQRQLVAPGESTTDGDEPRRKSSSALKHFRAAVASVTTTINTVTASQLAEQSPEMVVGEWSPMNF